MCIAQKLRYRYVSWGSCEARPVLQKRCNHMFQCFNHLDSYKCCILLYYPLTSTASLKRHSCGLRKNPLLLQSTSDLFSSDCEGGLAKLVHLTFNTWAGSLQWVAHTSLDTLLLQHTSRGQRPWSSSVALRISRLHAAGKRQQNSAFTDFYAHAKAFPVASSPLKLLFP